MSWITLDNDDIKARIAGPLFEAVESSALADGQNSPWQDLIEGAVNYARGSIASHTANTLGDGLTVPTAAVRHTITLAVWDGCNRFGLESWITDSMQEDFKAANRYFERVAEGRQTVELPETIDDSTIMPVEEGGFEVVDVEKSQRRKATRQRLDGL